MNSTNAPAVAVSVAPVVAAWNDNDAAQYESNAQAAEAAIPEDRRHFHARAHYTV